MRELRSRGERVLDAVMRIVLVPLLGESLGPLRRALPDWTFVRSALAAVLWFAVMRAFTGFIFTVIGAAEGGSGLRAEVVHAFRWLTGPRARWLVFVAIAAITGGIARTLASARGLPPPPEVLPICLAGGTLAALGFLRICRESSERTQPIGQRPEVCWSLPFAGLCVLLRLTMIPIVLTTLVLHPQSSLYVLTLWLALAAATFTPRAEVGFDGVYIRSFPPRFLPFTGDVRWSWTETGFALDRPGERSVRFRYRKSDADRRHEVEAKISALTRAESAPFRTLPAFARLTTVAAALEASAEGTGYRAPSVERDDLWSIAQLASASPRVRVQAIAEILADETAGDRERIDAIVETAANPAARLLMRRSK